MYVDALVVRLSTAILMSTYYDLFEEARVMTEMVVFLCNYSQIRQSNVR